MAHWRPTWRLGWPRDKTKKLKLSHVNSVGSTLLIFVETKTGVSCNWARVKYIKPSVIYEQETQKTPKITVGIPNEGKMISTKEWKLALPQVPETARYEHILAGVTHSTLIPTRNMCDAEYKVLLTGTSVHIIKYKQTTLKVTRKKLDYG